MWAHNLTLVACCMLVVLGMFGMLWTNSGRYGCEIDGSAIAPELIRFGSAVQGRRGRCSSSGRGNATVIRRACCDPTGRSSKRRNVGGSHFIGLGSIVGGVVILLLEQNSPFGIGLWMPAGYWYTARLSHQGIIIGLAGTMAIGTPATATGGVVAIIAAIVYSFAAWRHEAGDGGRTIRRRRRRQKQHQQQHHSSADPPPPPGRRRDDLGVVVTWSRWIFGTTSTMIWVAIYVAANVGIFFATLGTWIIAVDKMRDDLRRDHVNLDNCNECPDVLHKPYTRWRDECHLNKILVRQGPLSYWAPLAKVCDLIF